MNTTETTTLLGEGAYGWIFHPAIPSSIEVNMTPTMVSKVFLEKEYADNEYKRAVLMMNNVDSDKHMILPKSLSYLSHSALYSELMNRNDTVGLKKLESFDSSQSFYQVIYEGKGDFSYHSFITNPDGFDLKDALNYVIQITKSVEYFVQNKLIHNDVKPGNVIITDGKTKFIDFGMSSRFSNYAQIAQDFPDDYRYWPIEKQLYSSISALVNLQFRDLTSGIPEYIWNDKIKDKRYDDVSKNVKRNFRQSEIIPDFYKQIVDRVVDAQVLMPTIDTVFYKTLKHMQIEIPDEIDTFQYFTDEINSLPVEFVQSSINTMYSEDAPTYEEFLMKLSEKKEKHEIEMNKLNEQFCEFYDKIDVFGLGLIIKETLTEYRNKAYITDDEHDVINKLDKLVINACQVNVMYRCTPTDLLEQLQKI